MRRHVVPFTAIMVLLLSIGLVVEAQQPQSSGNIVGRVIDVNGDPLPGVTITLTGVGAPLTAVTRADGRYRFPNLAPGNYVVGASLSGFGEFERTARVMVGLNTEIDFTLSPAMQQTITVNSQSPLLDTREMGTGANVTEVELQNVPTARDPWVILQTVPGILVDRVNVGGNESGQQSYFVSKGAERHQTEWNLDGVTVTEMTATGTSGFYYDFESFEEFNVTTASSDPSVKTPGAQVNMVTRRGTNDFTGGVRYHFTDDSLQDTATVPSEARDYLELGNSIDRIEEYGIQTGGPAIRDRLWLWGALSRNEIRNAVAESIGGTLLENVNLKVNWQVMNNNSASAFYMWNNKEVDGRGLGLNEDPAGARDQTGPGDVIKIEDTHIFSPNFFMTGMVGVIDNGYKLAGRNGDIEPYWDGRRPPPDGFSRGWRRNNRTFEQEVPQDQATLDASWFFDSAPASHEMKFGFGYRDAPVDSIVTYPGSMSWAEFYDWGSLAAMTRPANAQYGATYYELYAGDTILIGDLTIQGGLRYDLQKAENFGSSVPGNPIIPEVLPGRTFAGDEEALEWESISPRIGATYTLGAENRTLLRAAYNRYVDQLGSSDVGAQNPFYNVQILYYYFEDVNGDQRVQRDEIDFDYGIYSWSNIDPNNPDASIATGRIDYSMDPTTTDELILGVEHELMPAFTVGLNYTYRIRDNFLWEQYEKTQGAGDFYTSDDWELAPDPFEATLPDGGTESVPYYVLRNGIKDPIYFVYTNRPGYEQHYQGLELSVTKRMSNNWMTRASVSFNDWTQEVSPEGVQDPNRLLLGDGCYTCDGSTVASAGGSQGYINSGWAGSVTALYQLPWQITAGANVTAREGYIIGYHIRERIDGERKRLVVQDFDDFRLEDLFQLDLRLAKDFALPGGLDFQLAADLFNATDERTVLWRAYELPGGEIEELQSPRLIRLSGRINW